MSSDHSISHLNNRYSYVKVTVPPTSSALSVRVLFTAYSAYG